MATVWFFTTLGHFLGQQVWFFMTLGIFWKNNKDTLPDDCPRATHACRTPIHGKTRRASLGTERVQACCAIFLPAPLRCVWRPVAVGLLVFCARGRRPGKKTSRSRAGFPIGCLRRGGRRVRFVDRRRRPHWVLRPTAVVSGLERARDTVARGQREVPHSRAVVPFAAARNHHNEKHNPL